MVASKTESPLLYSPIVSFNAVGAVSKNGLLPHNKIVEISPADHNPMGLWAVAFTNPITPNGHPVIQSHGIPLLEPEIVDAVTQLPTGLQERFAAMETVSPSTFNHSIRVARFNNALHERLGIKPSTKTRRLAVQEGLLHDIGKIANPKMAKLTNSARKYSVSNRKDLHYHPVYGAEICAWYFGWKHPITISAGNHHEMYRSNKGYPNGILGDKIPIEARILKLADVAEAMSNPHRTSTFAQPASNADILETIRSGPEFDPKLVEILLPVISMLLAYE